jgi:hypothetical protein
MDIDEPCDLSRMLTQAIDAHQSGGIFTSPSGSSPKISHENEISFTTGKKAYSHVVTGNKKDR